MENILDCPCCGSNDLDIGVQSSLTYGVHCNGCGLSIEREIPYENEEGLSLYQIKQLTLDKAIAAWNTRPEAIKTHFCNCREEYPDIIDDYGLLACEICHEAHICEFCELPRL